MSVHRCMALAVFAAFLGACQAPTSDQPPSPIRIGAAAPPSIQARVPLAAAGNRVLLKAVDEECRRQAVEAGGGHVIGEVVPLGVAIVELRDAGLGPALRRMRRVPGVIFAEPDHVAVAVAPPPGKGWNRSPEPAPSTDCVQSDPNDPAFNENKQWGLLKIQAQQAWTTNGDRSDAGVVVAILDTGIDQDHEDLDKIVYNTSYSTTSVDDRYGHGTHVAGIAAAATHNCLGVAGAGYAASLMNIKVLDDNGSGYYSWIASGITEAADRGAKVINLSLGGTASSATLESAVDYAYGKGALVVAAAGNSGDESLLYPAAYANCMAVAATDADDRKAGFSSYGAWVEIAAPGVEIYSTMPNHRNRIGPRHYTELNGTSMATPFVSGMAAILWGARPGASNAAIRDRITSTAVSLQDPSTGWRFGRIDLFQATTGW